MNTRLMDRPRDNRPSMLAATVHAPHPESWRVTCTLEPYLHPPFWPRCVGLYAPISARSPRRSISRGSIPSVPQREVMALVPCDAEGLHLLQRAHFVALEGTRTFSLRFADVFIPASWILADPVGPYLAKIRSGFILMQIGMALGLVQGCIEIMRKADRTHKHLNCFLPDRPEMFEAGLAGLREEVQCLARTPWESDAGFKRRVLANTAQSGGAVHPGCRRCPPAHWRTGLSRSCSRPEAPP
jgi:hypothetical protein